MTEQRRRAATIAFFILLLVIDWSLYFRHAGHFFPGDTVFALNHRGTSVPGYFREFVVLNASGWFRPLTHELFESILFPLAGLHPIPYRLPVYTIFVAVTILVYQLTLMLTSRPLAAAIASVFFTIHTVNAYTTYDISFMPELFFGFFYVGAVIVFLRYLRNGSKTMYWLSVLAFAGALLSKESAVTLPGVLFMAVLAFEPPSQTGRQRLAFAVRAAVPHAAVLVLYLAYAVGYLDVAGVSIRGLFDLSQKPAFGDYTPVFNGGVITDARLAATWALNIPRGWWGQWRPLSPMMLMYLKAFRALAVVLAVIMLRRPERKIILFGIAWFWIAILPALPIATHFIPYYLFVPVVGLALVVGISFSIAYDWARSVQPHLAAAGLVIIFGGLLYVNSRSIRTEIRDNRILGGSAKLAADTLSDLRHLYPSMPAGTTLYFLDGAESIQWEHDSGGLIRMAYGNNSIKALYQSGGDALPDAPNVTLIAVHGGHLSPATDDRR